MRKLLVLCVLLAGCYAYPEDYATKAAEGEYRTFDTELYLEKPEHEGLLEPDDGAKVAHEVFRLWGVDGLPEWGKVWNRLDRSKVFVLSEERTRDACLVPDDVDTPAGCLYAYDDKPKPVINAESIGSREGAIGLLCHEFIHAAAWSAYLVPDYGHEDPNLWAGPGGKDSLEFRCRQKALVLAYTQ